MGQGHERRAPPVIGKGRFVVCDHLGDGGTAGVYLAWDRERGSWCALKALLHAHLKDDATRRRFRAEAETMAALVHPNIPRLIAHDMSAMPPYIAMELARCGSVMGWVKAHGRMPASLAVDVLVQVCEAVHLAHESGVIHRDIKPHNFLLDDAGVCKLTDFGIARVDEHTSMTATGSQIGTFSFMAPEQRSDTKSVDRRADVYALGASLYTMLTARTSAELFIAEDDDQILAAVPLPFRDVVIRACKYRPDERYPTARDFQAALFNALARLPTTQSEYPPLVQPAEALPEIPPRDLPADRHFDDLKKSLALDLDAPTYVPSPAARAALERALVGTPVPTYAMRREAPALTGAPSYLDPTEAAKEARRDARLEADRLSATIGATPAPAARQAPEASHRWLETGLYGVGGVLLAALLALLLSAGWVALGRRGAEQAAHTFDGVLQSESSVAYEVGGDASFEQLYQRYSEARGTERVVAAVMFADALERAASKQVQVDPRTNQRVQRILSARDAYAVAHEAWRWRASNPPGSVAVVIGLARAP